METIQEITFVHETKRVTYKLYQYEQEKVKRKIVKVKIGEITQTKGYKYEDNKVIVTMYALHQESIVDGEYQDKLVCETELYATILSIIKDILKEYINEIETLQTPMK